MLLPKLLKELSKIPDPRQPKKVKHKLTVVLLYGLLSFVLQMASRREANRELSRPAFLATLQALFPELESLPHADTLHRLLQGNRLAPYYMYPPWSGCQRGMVWLSYRTSEVVFVS